MALSEAFTLSASVSSTEVSVVTGTTGGTANTTAGVYQLFVDPVGAAMAKGDSFQISVYEKCRSGDTQRLVFRGILNGAQSEMYVTPTLILLNGWDMGIKKLAGTDRTFLASIRKAS